MIIDRLHKGDKELNKDYKDIKKFKKGGQIMNKIMFRKIVCLVIALLMMMPVMPSSLVRAEDTSLVLEQDTQINENVQSIAPTTTSSAIGFTVEHYKQQDGGIYSDIPDESETFTTEEPTVFDDDYAKTYDGYIYSSGAVDEISQLDLSNDKENILKLYYELELAISPMAIGDGGVYTTEGGIMDAMGASTNSHLLGYLAWIEEGTEDLYVAFNASDTAIFLKNLEGAIYYTSDMTAISRYGGALVYEEISGPITIDGTTYNPSNYSYPNWLVINLGEITFSDPFYVGLDYKENGFDAMGKDKIRIDISNYIVQYNPNGGTGTMTDTENPYNDGETVTVLSSSFTYGGFYFIGWNTKADGSGTPYNPGDTFEMPKSDVTLYAQWSQYRELTVTADSSSKIYDGMPLTDDGYTYTGILASGDSLVVTVVGTITNVGTKANEITEVKVMNGATDVTANYNITEVNGTLEVTKRTVTLISKDLSKPYDGTALTNGSKPLEAETGWITGEGATYTFTGSQTDVGFSANAFSYILKAGTLLSNYTINKTEGKLTVTKATGTTLNITNYAGVYDGSSHSIIVTNLVTGDTVSYSEDGTTWSETNPEYKNVGENIVYVKVTNPNYADRTGTGTVTITPKTVTLKSKDLNKVYDGTALTNGSEPLETETGWITGEGATYTFTGSQTDVGFSANAFSFTVKAGTLLSNYTISKTEGKLTVTKAIGATLNITNYAGVYDGVSHSITATNLVTGDTVSYSEDGTTWSETNPEYKNVGEYTVYVKVTNPNYADRTGTGTVAITPKTVTLKSKDLSKVYDGTALTNSNEPLETETGWITGEGATYTFTGSQTDVGFSANAFSFTLKAGTLLSNYTINKTEGKLTVTKRAITITAASAEKPYDGTPLTNNGYSITSGILAPNHTLESVTVTGSQLYVGESANVASNAVIVEVAASESLVTSNYDITYVDGTLEITDADIAITVTADSNSKIYDGMPLTDDGYTYTGTLATGDSLVVTVVGTITNVGTTTNEITEVKVMNGATDVTANYNITEVDGLLTVTARPLTITAASAEKPYDGTPLTNNGYSITSGTLAPNHTLESVTVTGSQLYVGESANIASNAVIVETIPASESLVTLNYDITYVDGTLEITYAHIAIMVTADSNSKIYDGMPLTDDGYTYTGTLATGDSLVVTVVGTITNVGTKPNVIREMKVMNGTTDVTDNYNIYNAPGILTITARELTITAASDEKPYDGTPLTNDGFSITSGTLAPNHTLESVTVTGSQLYVGNSANVASNAVIVEAAASESLVTSNYDITYVDGTLAITEALQIDITVEKEWIDEVEQPTFRSDISRPSITIRLMVGETEIDNITFVYGETDYRHTFENLPKFDSSGEVIEYIVVEDNVKGYYSSVYGPYEDGQEYFFYITNSLKPIYTVTYNANGGSGTMAIESYNEDDSVTIKSNSFTRSNYRFTGWNTKADGSGTSYAAGNTFTMPANDVTLYAQWSRRSNPPVIIIPDPDPPLADLEKFDHFAYVIGYPDGEVKPGNNITREEVAMIFYRLLTDNSRNQLLSDVNPFTDLENHDWSNRAISTLYNGGIIKGYPDGTFRPSDPITRAEFATIAAKFDKLELNNTTKFTDIFGHWAEKYITSSEIKGWIKGYPDLTFKPEQDITRAEAMTLINNVLERAVPEENIHPDAMFWPDIESDDWYYEAVMEATNSHDYVKEEDGDELWTGMKPNKVWP